MVSIDGTLHLLLVSPRDWPIYLTDLAHIWQPLDQLLLMTAAVQGHSSDMLLPFAQQRPIGLYQPDAAQMQRITPLPSHLQLVSSELWATWTLDYMRCMTWRSASR